MTQPTLRTAPPLYLVNQTFHELIIRRRLWEPAASDAISVLAGKVPPRVISRDRSLTWWISHSRPRYRDSFADDICGYLWGQPFLGRLDIVVRFHRNRERDHQMGAAAVRAFIELSRMCGAFGVTLDAEFGSEMFWRRFGLRERVKANGRSRFFVCFDSVSRPETDGGWQPGFLTEQRLGSGSNSPERVAVAYRTDPDSGVVFQTPITLCPVDVTSDLHLHDSAGRVIAALDRADWLGEPIGERGNFWRIAGFTAATRVGC